MEYLSKIEFVIKNLKILNKKDFFNSKLALQPKDIVNQSFKQTMVLFFNNEKISNMVGIEIIDNK